LALPAARQLAKELYVPDTVLEHVELPEAGDQPPGQVYVVVALYTQ
jgi:hypothetical protein